MPKFIKRLILILLGAAVIIFVFFVGTRFPYAKSNFNPTSASNQTTGPTDPDVRTELKEDGIRFLWIRSNDRVRLTQYVFTSNGSLLGKKVYRMDLNGKPLGCKIYDASNIEIFKVSFGYNRSSGLLVEEQFFDSRVKRLGPDQVKEVPVRRVIYSFQEGAEDPTLTLIDTDSVILPNSLLMAYRDPFGNQQQYRGRHHSND
jgi:hypothetical protein